MKNISYLLILLVLSSCDNVPKKSVDANNANNTQVIIDYSDDKDFEKTTLSLSDIADSISYIRLSSMDVLISDINQITIMPQEEIAIFSNGLVYRFDKTGNYIDIFYSSGRGPNEAIVPCIPSVNSTNRQVIVNDYASNSFKIFDVNRKNIGGMPSSVDNGKSYREVCGFIDNYLFSYTYNEMGAMNQDSLNYYTANLLEVQNIDTKECVYTYPNPDADFRYRAINDRIAIQVNNRDIFVGKTNGEYWFNIRDMDTIFTTADFKDITPKYILKQPEPKYTPRIRMMQSNRAYDKELTKNSRMIGIAQSDKYVFISYSNQKTPRGICYDTKAIKTLGFGAILNDIDGIGKLDLANLIAYGVICDNKFYFPINAIELIDSDNEDKFRGLNENSNPIIMVIHLKK